MGNITSKELAQKLGVSAAAVSIALNGKTGISDKTRNMILNAALEQGFTPAISKENKTKQQSKTICYLVITDKYVKSGEHSLFESMVLYGVDAAAHAIGYNILVKYTDVRNVLDQNILDLLTSADGLVILAADINQSTVSIMRKLMEITKDIPKVILDNMILAGEEDCIGNDNFYGSSLATKALIDSGCKKIGYIKSKSRLLNFDERELGLKSTLENNNMSLFTTVDVGLSSAESYVDITNWLNSKPKLPDAFFADNDVLAISAIRAIKAHGLSVPEDISIIGFDDIPMAEMTEPTLSTIKCSKEDLGIAAVYDLYTKININQDFSNIKAIRKTYMTPSLIIRDSTK